MKRYEGNMKKYDENIKKYEGIMKDVMKNPGPILKEIWKNMRVFR